MIRTIVGSSFLVFATYAAFGQAGSPSFEAASLKPTASPSSPDRTMRMMSGGPGSSDPGRFTYTNVTLKLLVEMAYNLKEFQVEGPNWVDDMGFDLIATMPQGTTKEQASQMMQTLLAERFKLEYHRETKPMPMFALIVGKGGSKMKEAETPTTIPDGPPPGGPRGMGRGPGIRMMMSPNGIHVAGQTTMTQFADLLTRQLGRPVVDRTELAKKYDVDITWMPDSMDGARMAPMGRGPEGPGGGGPEAALSLAQALDEKLGLKLDPRKSPAEVFIIDRAEKTPVEN
jgi:uncharacterized protein (TIGR03435 family)